MAMNTGRRLIEAVRNRGWNLYDSTSIPDEPDEIHGAETIFRGPVDSLTVGRRFVLLPVAEKPDSPEQVFAVLDRVAVALDRAMPTVEVSGGRYPLTGILIREPDRIKINNPVSPLILSYDEAVQVARTLFNTRTLRYD